jgi:uncharacterized protein
MDFCFFDSSATVKNYIIETGTNWVKSVFITIPKTEIYMASITEVEVVAAFSRRRKGNTLSKIDANTAIIQFKTAFVTDFNTVEITPKIISSAVDFADKHSLRGYDAVQLASALEIYSRLIAIGVDFNLTPFTFVSADNELNSAASLEGLSIENPNNYP